MNEVKTLINDEINEYDKSVGERLLDDMKSIDFIKTRTNHHEEDIKQLLEIKTVFDREGILDKKFVLSVLSDVKKESAMHLLDKMFIDNWINQDLDSLPFKVKNNKLKIWDNDANCWKEDVYGQISEIIEHSLLKIFVTNNNLN